MGTMELLADEIDGRLHVAIAHKGILDNLYVDPMNCIGAWASIYNGRVAKIDTGLDAAFIDLGDGMTGFLPAKHIYTPGADASERRTGISKLVEPGQMVMVQIKAEAKRDSEHEHHKLPRLTTKLYTFGQHLVYSPRSSRVAVSHRVENENVIKAATRLKGAGGWLVQSSAEHASEEELQTEAQCLLDEWNLIVSSCESSGDKPRLLRAGPNAILRALCDYGTPRFSHIYVGNKKLLEIVEKWSEKFSPRLATSKRLRLFRPESAADKLFEMHDLYSQTAALQTPCVALDGGGSIIIEPTQALIVIDVNRGSAPSVAAVNKSAAHEVARQTRIRNLSGAVLVDFINMQKRTARAELVDILEQVFRSDVSGAQVHGFTRLGIIEITRKRRTATLAENLRH